MPCNCVISEPTIQNLAAVTKYYGILLTNGFIIRLFSLTPPFSFIVFSSEYKIIAVSRRPSLRPKEQKERNRFSEQIYVDKILSSQKNWNSLR